MKNLFSKFLTVALALTMIVGCQAVKNTNNKTKGAAIGAASGAILGAILGNNVGSGDNSELGAVIGGVVGGTAGVLIGARMDKQAKEIENQIPGAEVTRVGDGIVVNFDENSGVFFKTAQSDVVGDSATLLTKLANVMIEYPDTNIIIAGHTDSQGAEASNLALSQRRAQSVERYLSSRGINANRFTTKWYGETNPVATNETAEGRAKNRRVTLAIVPNEKMKEDAAKEAGK